MVTVFCFGLNSDIESSMDPQVPFIPSVEVLVKCLLLIAPAAVASSPASYSRLLFCSHHPCITSTTCPNGVWKVLVSLLSIFVVFVATVVFLYYVDSWNSVCRQFG